MFVVAFIAAAAVVAVSVETVQAVCVFAAVWAERTKVVGDGRRATTWRAKRRRTRLLILACVVVVVVVGSDVFCFFVGL